MIRSRVETAIKTQHGQLACSVTNVKCPLPLIARSLDFKPISWDEGLRCPVGKYSASPETVQVPRTDNNRMPITYISLAEAFILQGVSTLLP